MGLLKESFCIIWVFFFLLNLENLELAREKISEKFKGRGAVWGKHLL